MLRRQQDHNVCSFSNSVSFSRSLTSPSLSSEKNGWAVYRYSLTHTTIVSLQQNQSGVSDEAGTAAIFLPRDSLQAHSHSFLSWNVCSECNTFPKMTINETDRFDQTSIAEESSLFPLHCLIQFCHSHFSRTHLPSLSIFRASSTEEYSKSFKTSFSLPLHFITEDYIFINVRNPSSASFIISRKISIRIHQVHCFHNNRFYLTNINFYQ